MTYNNCKSQAIKDLKDYNYLKSSLSTLPKRIEVMRSCALPSGSGFVSVPSGCTPGDDKMINYLSHIEHLENILAANTLKVQCIETALAALPAKDKELLASYYINRQRNTVTNLAYKSFSDRSSIYRRAQRALEKYILAFFGEYPA